MSHYSANHVRNWAILLFLAGGALAITVGFKFGVIHVSEGAYGLTRTVLNPIAWLYGLVVFLVFGSLTSFLFAFAQLVEDQSAAREALAPSPPSPTPAS